MIPVRRVLMTTDAVGGVWRYSLDLAQAFRTRNVETTLALMGPPAGAAQRREASIRKIRLVESTLRLEWMDGGDDDFAAAGEWLLALERQIQPDLVHLNGYAHAALPWTSPVLVVAHSCVRTWWRAVKGAAAPAQFDRYSSLVADGLEAADAIIAPTNAMISALRREYRVRAATEMIPNACAAPAILPEPKWHTKENLVLSAGRAWDEAKNIASLSRAAGRLTWPVYVAGRADSPDGHTRELDHVLLIGQLPGAALREWYKRAAIYALPARYEPFGLSVLEAASAGCALVIGDIASLRENWDGAALFVTPGNDDALASAIQALIDDPEWRVELGRRAFARSAAFTINRTADEYLRVYNRLAA